LSLFTTHSTIPAELQELESSHSRQFSELERRWQDKLSRVTGEYEGSLSSLQQAMQDQEEEWADKHAALQVRGCSFYFIFIMLGEGEGKER
jgi:hypothetical protein